MGMNARTRTYLAALLSSVCVVSGAAADGILGPQEIGGFDGISNPGAPAWVLPGFAANGGIDCYFAKALYYPSAAACALTVTRATTNGTATDLLPTSLAGASFNAFGNNVARLTPGVGILIEEARSNFLTNSTAPATQTTGSLNTGTYTLWVNGPGSAIGTAGTGVGCPVTTATQGSPISFTITVAGTCVVTVVGSLNAFQLELNPGAVSNPTSLIVTAGTTGARGADIVSLTTVPTFGSSYSTFFSGIPNSPMTFATGQGGLDLNGSSTDRSELNRQATSGDPNVVGASTASGTYFNANMTPAWATGALGKMAAGWAPSDQAVVFDAGTPTTNATGTPVTSPTITRVSIGAAVTGTQRFWNGYMVRDAFAPTTRLPNATLQLDTNLATFN